MKEQKVRKAIHTVTQFIRDNPELEAVTTDPQDKRNQCVAEAVICYLELHHRLAFPSELERIDNMVIPANTTRLWSLLESAIALHHEVI